MRTFKTGNGTIHVDDETFDGNPVIVVEDFTTNEPTTASIHLDNYQTYQLAMTLLRTLEVDDTRGSK